jgi:hypothetical protein
VHKTEVTINVYDLLPVSGTACSVVNANITRAGGRARFTNHKEIKYTWSRITRIPKHHHRVYRRKNVKKTVLTSKQPSSLSTVLWTIGSSLHHSGVALSVPNRDPIEYAYGGHPQPNKTGVYHTPPLATPPGATFRCSILHGISFLSPEEIDKIVQNTAAKFMGREYDLLSKNCNHFTSELCFELTGRRAPGWLNRAAGVGVRLPCVVPKEWVRVPEADDEELVDEDGDGGGEREGMLEESRRSERRGVNG